MLSVQSRRGCILGGGVCRTPRLGPEPSPGTRGALGQQVTARRAGSPTCCGPHSPSAPYPLGPGWPFPRGPISPRSSLGPEQPGRVKRKLAKDTGLRRGPRWACSELALGGLGCPALGPCARPAPACDSLAPGPPPPAFLTDAAGDVGHKPTGPGPARGPAWTSLCPLAGAQEVAAWWLRALHTCWP